jgi:hypothetical protein
LGLRAEISLTHGKFSTLTFGVAFQQGGVLVPSFVFVFDGTKAAGGSCAVGETFSGCHSQTLPITASEKPMVL